MVRTPDGRSVPLQSVVEVSFGEGVQRINRRNGERVVRVVANVERDAMGEISRSVNETFIPTLKDKYPGLRVLKGGTQEASWVPPLSTLSPGYLSFSVGIKVSLTEREISPIASRSTFATTRTTRSPLRRLIRCTPSPKLTSTTDCRGTLLPSGVRTIKSSRDESCSLELQRATFISR